MKKILITFFLLVFVNVFLKAQDSTNLASKWRKSLSLNTIYNHQDIFNVSGEFSKHKNVSFLAGLNYNPLIYEFYPYYILYREKPIQNISSFIGARIYPNGQENRFSFYFQSDFIYQNFSKGILDNTLMLSTYKKRENLNNQVSKIGNANAFDFFLGIGFKYKISDTFFFELATKYSKQISNHYDGKYSFYDKQIATQYGFGIVL